MTDLKSQARPDPGLPDSAQTAIKVLRRISLGYLAFLITASLLATQIPQTWPLWLTFRLVILQDTWLLAAMFVLGAMALQPFWTSARIPLTRLPCARPTLAASLRGPGRDVLTRWG